MITDGYKANFNTLQRAAEAGDIALMECTDTATGKPVMVICATQKRGEEIAFVPLAKLFDGNPYDELDPPNMRTPQ